MGINYEINGHNQKLSEITYPYLNFKNCIISIYNIFVNFLFLFGHINWDIYIRAINSRAQNSPPISTIYMEHLTFGM